MRAINYPVRYNDEYHIVIDAKGNVLFKTLWEGCGFDHELGNARGKEIAAALNGEIRMIDNQEMKDAVVISNTLKSPSIFEGAKNLVKNVFKKKRGRKKTVSRRAFKWVDAEGKEVKLTGSGRPPRTVTKVYLDEVNEAQKVS
jgi:hypothetical protein